MTDIVEGKQDKNYSPAESAQRWEKELTAAEKELKKFHTSSKRVVKRYLDQRDSSGSIDQNSRFCMNLFWSNVQVLKSALYVKPPDVDVSNAYKDSEDDVSRVAGNILQRVLNHSIEKDGSDFDIAARGGIEDYLTVGLGQLWYRYEVETETEEIPPTIDPTTGEEMVEATEYEVIVNEEVATDYVYWDDFWWSPARTWSEVRWVARRIYMNREELVKRFGDKIGKSVPVGKLKKDADASRPQNDPWEKAQVFEIWDRTTRKVYWHARGYNVVLDEKDDPLQLQNFFPCPSPLMSNLSTSNLMPRADFVMAQDQYDQIDELTTRITWLTRAAKVVGCYDKSSTALGRIFTEGMENQLIPVENWAAFSEKGGVNGQMAFIPLQEIAATIERLTAQRENIKQALYEVLGIGDIMRGMTNADETATAQQLKAQFGGSRLQYKQFEIGQWVAEGQRIHAEIICKHFQPQTILERSNIMRSMDAQLAQPAVQMLKQPELTKYRITVQAESMAMVDWAQERDAAIQFMQAFGGFVNSVAPMIQQQPSAAPMLMQMAKWALGKFRISKEIESVMDQAIASASQPTPPPQPSPMEQAQVEEKKASAFQKKASGQRDLALAGKDQHESVAQQQENAVRQQAMQQTAQMFNPMGGAPGPQGPMPPPGMPGPMQ